MLNFVYTQLIFSLCIFCRLNHTVASRPNKGGERRVDAFDGTENDFISQTFGVKTPLRELVRAYNSNNINNDLWNAVIHLIISFPLQLEPHFDFNLKWGANTPIGCIAECHSVTTLT